MTGQQRKGALGRDLASMSGWQIAQAFGCHYTGDYSPIPHGGLFYSLEEWAKWGYARCVDLCEIDGAVHVALGTINRQEGERMVHALACIGIGPDEEHASNPHTQVEACRAYFGMETDNERIFPLATWREERIWKKVAPWISELEEDRPVSNPTVAALAERWSVDIMDNGTELWARRDTDGWIPFWDGMVDAGLEPTAFREGEIYVGFRVRS